MSQVFLNEAVPLAHALVARVADDADVRILFIKGPAATRQGLRPERLSVDVDAWADPRRRGVLAARLAELGWVDEHPYTSPTVLPMHSLTLRHPSWMCELDLHDRFPGFFADVQSVFEVLWERRASVAVAGREVPCPDAGAHALVLALHSLRDPHDPMRADELSGLVERVRAVSDEYSLRDLADLAAALGAADTAEPFLDQLGAPAIGRGTTAPDDLLAWRLRTRPHASVAGWLAGLRATPPTGWPRYLWYAVWLSERELRADDPGLPPGRSAVRRARLRRLRRGLSAMPAALASVRADRHARRTQRRTQRRTSGNG